MTITEWLSYAATSEGFFFCAGEIELRNFLFVKQAASNAHVFLLSVFDREQWCCVLATRIEVTDLELLRTLLGADSDDDPTLDQTYDLDEPEAIKIAEAFGTKLDLAALASSDRVHFICRPKSVQSAPYLVHTGYELPLLLDGRKKLARMTDAYPPPTFPGEDRFDHWVATGQLHKEVVTEPFKGPTTNRFGWQGTRMVYYTTKGEEWRIPAMKLLWDAGARAGWNEHFERLEGMLFGYEDWQNDWWIETGLSGGGFAGLRLCCRINEEGLAWIKAAGYRALPPIDQPELMLDFYDGDTITSDQIAQHGTKEIAAIAVFSVGGKGALDLFEGLQGPPWHLPRAKIPDLNALLLRSIMVKPMKADATGERP